MRQERQGDIKMKKICKNCLYHEIDSLYAMDEDGCDIDVEVCRCYLEHDDYHKKICKYEHEEECPFFERDKSLLEFAKHQNAKGE